MTDVEPQACGQSASIRGINPPSRWLDLVGVVRPKHWFKNGIIFLPVIFGQRLHVGGAWLQAGIAAMVFSLVASAIYIINDLEDCDQDRKHPVKKNRPVASGKITRRVASLEATVLLVAGLTGALASSRSVFCVVLAYLLLQLAYTFYFKHRVIVDVMCIAADFVLRALAGAVAIDVPVSPWLVVCTFSVCLFMGFCKRRSEAAGIDNHEDAIHHRATLLHYTPELLTYLVALSAGIAVITYMLYATSPDTVERFRTNYLIYTFPLVLYSIFRFTMLSIEARYSDPTELILNDRPFQMSSALWLICVTSIILWGESLEAWLAAV